LVSDKINDIRAFADLNMIESVLRNLISNAIKFTDHGGKIIISASIEDNHCNVSIEDNGRGIPNSNIDKIFNIGDHISTNGTDDEKGSGLGLILCKEFVNKNGGKIWAESKINIGSKFSFSIPLASN
jgi:signal transduction histidine kinase